MQTINMPGLAWPDTLPPQTTPFFGRESELADIFSRLSNDDCRMLTLIGPGGAGKTRLALECAAASAGLFTEGVYFANLEPVRSLDVLVHALVGALRLPLSGQDDPLNQVIDLLRDKHLLLILDNFEQLIEGAEMIGYLLRYTTRLKLLVTSRIALNLVEEHLYPVSGMAYPSSPVEADLSTYPAVQMFAACARRRHPGFDLDGEREGVLRICRLVDGMPLAIELAASWTRMMRCSEIADEIDRSIHFLSSGPHNLPERHRSIQAVFHHSWEALNNEQRDVFTRLSVFHNGFHREAAYEIAEANLATLSALLDHSLLRRSLRQAVSSGRYPGNPTDRYMTHEILRQFAWEKLSENQSTLRTIRDRHSQYYLRWAYGRLLRFHAGDQVEAVEDLRADFENVRAAWNWGLGLGEPSAEAIARAALSLHYFFQCYSRYVEGAEMMANAARVLKEHVSLGQPLSENMRFALAVVQNAAAWFFIRLGRYDEASEAGRESAAFYAEINRTEPGIGSDSLVPLAVLAQVRGDFEQAVQLAKEAYRRAEEHGDPINQAVADYALAGAYLAQGKYELAMRHARAAALKSDSFHDRWFKAYALVEWGNAAAALGDYDEARRHYQAAYAIRQIFSDPEGMAVALNHLGQIALLQEDYEQAGQLFSQARVIYEEIFDRGGLATTLDGLCQAALGKNQLPQARDLAIQALQTTSAIGFVPLTLSILCSISALFFQFGQGKLFEMEGCRLLHYVKSHSAAGQETQKRAARILATRPPRQTGLEDAGEITGLSMAVELALGGLQSHSFANPQTLETPGSSEGTTGLIEPLSDREIEVLRGIADGLSNQEIASLLTLSIGTVKWYTSQIFGKLNVSSRTRAISRARELKLIL